jgi:drug/metabolite transporter (DMT)-like permease
VTLSIALAVLLAAVLHASWNALIRFHGDRLAMMTLLAAFGAVFALPAALWLGPPDPASWPWMAASVTLHVGYNVFLASAYNHGELGRIYPLARGTAPLVTLVAGVSLFGHAVDGWQATGVATLAFGIMILAFEGGWQSLRRSPRGAVYALVTSLFIAAYTLSDGMGARASGNAHAYVSWLFVLDGIPLLVYGLVTGAGRTGRAFAGNWKAGSMGGALSLGAYWIAIWAMTVAPIALVAALRESSVVFAALIGVLFLGETHTRLRTVSIVAVVAGLVMLRV